MDNVVSICNGKIWFSRMVVLIVVLFMRMSNKLLVNVNTMIYQLNSLLPLFIQSVKTILEDHCRTSWSNSVLRGRNLGVLWVI